MNEVDSGGKVGLPCGPATAGPDRREAARAVRLWAGTTLSSVVILATLAIWHLVRRGRLIQDGLGPAKPSSGLDDPRLDSTGPP